MIGSLDWTSVREWMAAFGAFGSLIAAIALAILTWRLVVATNQLAAESKAVRLAQREARIEMAVEPDRDRVWIMELVIRNVGPATAKAVRVEAVFPRKDGKPQRQQTLQLASVLPGSEFRWVVDSAHGHTDEAVVTARASFQDDRGTHTTLLEQSITGWYGFGRGSSLRKKATDSIAEIAAVLRAVTRNGGRIQSDIFTAEDRVREEMDYRSDMSVFNSSDVPAVNAEEKPAGKASKSDEEA